ncbi:MAG: hypothetical protein KKA73_03485 [Chloroflexi bacterium]|nr:hypothetical protein [Chloroflexota bacterium]MBU1746727.1 hypothetical protein [Chloroflexota bacterium]MBU1879616.1 hypothetical protein [Chloroflexota bacterium]
MDPLTIPPERQAEMLGRLMLAWDGQWFLKVVERFGLEAGVETNARVRAAFGRIEMRETLRALGRRQATDLADAGAILHAYMQAFMGRRMRADLIVTEDRLEIVVQKCAAYQGARLAGLDRVDQACVACEALWPVYMETLLPDKPVRVELVRRQGRGDATCLIVIEREE